MDVICESLVLIMRTQQENNLHALNIRNYKKHYT